MKKAFFVISIAFLGQTTLANAATDWTPYLKPMMSGCSFPNPAKNPPAHYKASILGNKTNIGTDNYGIHTYRGDKVVAYTLKDATAFGKPLAKIEYLSGFEWGHVKLYFKDTSFTALRPKFKVPNSDQLYTNDAAVTKNDASGYDVEDIGTINLIFDTDEKSITCFAGH